MAVLVQSLVIAVAVSYFGVAYVNLDNFEQAPVTFSLLFIVPFWFGLASLLLAFLPRLLQIQFLLFVLFWAVAELVFAVINLYQPQLEGEGEARSLNQPQYYVDDAILGYKVMPNNTARHVETYGTKKISDVIYSVDQLGRRITPIDSPGSRTNFLLFFGDSNTFGDGLGQKQTLPYYAGRFAPDYRPYNYALSGYGPAQMLDLVKTRALAAEVGEQQGFAFFFFIQDHIARVIGSSQVSTTWGRHFSHYVLRSDGELVREGNFTTGRPFLTLFYECVGWSNVVSYFDLRLPIRYSERDYQLAAAIMAESQKRVEKMFKLKGFYVLIAPVFDEQELYIAQRFMGHLNERHVRFLDFSRLYDPNDQPYTIAEEDAHNSGLANRVIAVQLVKELGIGTSKDH